MTGIKVAADMYRAHGQWFLHICAPEWVIKEWVETWHAGGKMGIANYGGAYAGDQLEMTIGIGPASEEKSDAKD